jgi:hypothetical protein
MNFGLYKSQAQGESKSSLFADLVRIAGMGLMKTDAQTTYGLCFQCSRYRWKAKEVSFPTQLVLCQKMLGADGNHHNKMISRMCQKSATPILGRKGLVHFRVARPCPWPLPKSRKTRIQVKEDDEDITSIQTMHGSTTRACAR